MATDDAVKRAETGLRIAQFCIEQELSKSQDKLPAVSAVEKASTKAFCANLSSVVDGTDPSKIQTCKDWIMAHIAPSEARIKTLGVLVVALSKSIIVDPEAKASKISKLAKNRTNVLMVVSDVLHAAKVHAPTTVESFTRVLKPYVEDLISLATSFATTKNSRVEKRVALIINSWAKGQLISHTDYREYRDRAKDGITIAQGGIRYELPDCFGDEANLPWFLLPASYMLQPMIDNPGQPIDTKQMRAISLNKKPASDKVQRLLRDFFDNLDLKYWPTGDNPTGETEKYKMSVDAMGQLVKEDKETHEKTIVCNSYGWSPPFCQDMRKNKVPAVIVEKREESKRKQQEKKLEEERRRQERMQLDRSSEGEGYGVQRRVSRFDEAYKPPQDRAPYQQTPSSSRPPSQSFTQPPPFPPQFQTAAYPVNQGFSNTGRDNFGTNPGHQNFETQPGYYNSGYHTSNIQSNQSNNYGYHNNSYEGRGYSQSGYNSQDHRAYDQGGYNNHGSYGQQGYQSSAYGNSGYGNQGGDYHSGPPQSQGGYRGGYRGGNRDRGGGGYRGRGNRRN